MESNKSYIGIDKVQCGAIMLHEHGVKALFLVFI